MKRSPIKRRRKPLRQTASGVIDRIASEAWAKGARTKPCAVCRRKGSGILIRGHHVIYQQELRRIATDLGMDVERLRWDDRNRLPLCDGCHERHHSGARRVSWGILRAGAPKVFQFAQELDRHYEDGRTPATLFLEREYLVI